MPRPRKTAKVEAKPKAPKITEASIKRHRMFMNMEWAAEQFPATFRIIGFDLAKFNTGWTVLHCETRNGEIVTELIDTGLIKCSAAKNSSTAVKTLYDEICKLMLKYEPDIVGYEYVAVLKDPTGFKALSKSEGILQVASKVGASEDRMLIPIAIKAAKKIALGGAEPDLVRAQADFKEIYRDRKLDPQLIGKIAIMNATKDSFGVGFTDDNICDSFLVANAVSYLAKLLHEADKIDLLAEYNDVLLQKWGTLKWSKPFDKSRFEVALSLCASNTMIRENDARANKKNAKTITELYRVISDPADRDIIRDDDSED